MADDRLAKSGRPDGEKDQAARRTLPTPAWAAVCAAALVVGVLAGYFLLRGTGGAISLSGRTSLSAGELDSTIATYTLDGQSHAVTAREVLAETYGSSIPANDDGTYEVPAARDVVSYAQNQILLAEAESRGLTATDEEVSSFTSSIYGSDDYATIGEQWGLDEDSTRQILSEQTSIKKLQDDVVTVTLPTYPTAPTEPAEGEEDVATADYASYVIDLLGDEWDSEANTWARTDGTYYATLSGYEISNDSATYAAAQAAYSVAQSAYSNAYNQLSAEWTDFANGILSTATIQLGSLAE